MIHYPNALEPFLGPKDEVIDFEKEALELLKEYIVHRKIKMIEICENAIKVDFMESTNPLPNDDNYPYTPACVEIFTMLNSQLDQLIESKMTWDSKFILDVVESASVVLMQYCVLTNSCIEESLSKISILKLCAFGNNAPMCKAKLDEYTSRILGVLSSKYHEKAMNYLSRVGDVGLQDLTNTVLNGLVSIMMEEFSTPFSEMFGEKWENYDTNPMKILGKKIDLFQAKSNFLEPPLSKIFYEKLAKRFILRYISALFANNSVVIKNKYEDDETFLDKFSDDIEQIQLIFEDPTHPVDAEFLDLELLPLRILKKLIKATFDAVENIEDYPFSLSEFLGEYPQAWDVALIIANKATIPNDKKNKMREFIDSDFDKIYKDGSDPSCDHIFRHFVKNYSISKLREADRKMKLLKQQQMAQIQKVKKVIQIPPKEEKKPVVVAPPPKEEQPEISQLDDLGIDIDDLDLGI